MILVILSSFIISPQISSLLVISAIIRLFILILIFYIYKYYRNEYVIVEGGYVFLKNGNRIKKRIPLDSITSFSCEEEFIDRMTYNEIDKLKVINEKMEYYAINSENGKKIILIKNLYDINDVNDLCNFCISKNNKIENLLSK